MLWAWTTELTSQVMVAGGVVLLMKREKECFQVWSRKKMDLRWNGK